MDSNSEVIIAKIETSDLEATTRSLMGTVDQTEFLDWKIERQSD